MINKIEELLAEIEAFAPQSAADVEAFRIKILGKKGVLGALMEELRAFLRSRSVSWDSVLTTSRMWLQSV